MAVVRRIPEPCDGSVHMRRSFERRDADPQGPERVDHLRLVDDPKSRVDEIAVPESERVVTDIEQRDGRVDTSQHRSLGAGVEQEERAGRLAHGRPVHAHSCARIVRDQRLDIDHSRGEVHTTHRSRRAHDGCVCGLQQATRADPSGHCKIATGICPTSPLRPQILPLERA